jgi:hypothetical protein|tara:strand:+ start:678 stop:932 length:255 start_codon:yes stop_codon:yes gene_type:complete
MFKVNNINLLLSLIKCVDEQMHLLKFEHKQHVKQKFNNMMQAAQAYEKAVYKEVKGYDPEEVEHIYDNVMDCILDITKNEKDKV